MVMLQLHRQKLDTVCALVLKYLESMSQEALEWDPPRSVIDSLEYESNKSAVRSPPLSPRNPQHVDRALSAHHDDINGDDIDSNFQEGRTSEIGDMGPNVCLLLHLFSGPSDLE
jgi:hypothetical protein